MEERHLHMVTNVRPLPRSVAFQRLHKPPLPRKVGTPDSADTPAPGGQSRLSSSAQSARMSRLQILYFCICQCSGAARDESVLPDSDRHISLRVSEPVRITTCRQLCNRDWKAWVVITLLRARRCQYNYGYDPTTMKVSFLFASPLYSAESVSSFTGTLILNVPILRLL